ncbi:MFS transporter [Candidatus Foliamicus sp.]
MQTMLDRLTRVEGSVPLSLRAGWGIGALGVALLFNTYSTLLLFYLTNIAGVAAGVAGLLLAIAKGYDWATDVPMGIVSDRTRSRFGRRRPWLLVGAFVCGPAFVMLFSTPTDVSDTVKAVYVLGALLLFNTGYTLFNVPHLSMPAEMSDNYDERTAIMSFRAIAIVLGTFAVGGFAPRLAQQFGGGIQGYAIVGWTLGITATVAMVACFAGTARARATKHVKARQGVRGQFRTAIRNVHFGKLAVFKMLTLLATGIAQGSVLFFVTEILGHSQGVMLFYGLGYASVSLVAAPVWAKLSRMTGKHTALIIATFGFMVFVMWWWIADPGEPVELLILRSMVLSFFAMGKLLLGMSLLPDVQEYDYLKTGLRREGVFAGAYNMVEKTAFIAAPLVVGLVLQWLGYESTVDDIAVDQDPRALTGIRVSIAAIPAVCNLFAGIILMRWTLTREYLEELRAKRAAT